MNQVSKSSQFLCTLTRAAAIAEMGGLDDLKEDQMWVACRSAAYRALMRGVVEDPGLNDLHSLGAIWEGAGCPQDKLPGEWLAAWRAQSEGNDTVSGDEVIEDRGEAGWWVNFELAAWFAHFLDPEVFEVQDVVAMCY